MSSHSRSQSDNTSDVEELLQIGTRCRELRREKDMLKESQSQSFDLIRRLERHVTSLSAASTEDKKCIEMLEKELMNCSQEIDYLQDQGNARNTEELESREVELQNSSLCIERLRMSISSITLDSQCEIESLKLEIVTLEQSCFEAEKSQEKAIQEKARINQLVRDLEAQFQDAQKNIRRLELENKELREKLDTSETKVRTFWQMLEKLLARDGSQPDIKQLVNEIEAKLMMSNDPSTCGEVLSPLISKLETLLGRDGDDMEKVENMLNQIEEYELLVKQLKEELREEKLKAKEEAEDLAQEMAELRYQMTGLLEEERNRRACIEQASTQRIAELEAQVQKEQRKSLDAVKYLHGA
ncbi:meiosis-specific nuclear structural protein 1 isoform X3 [Morus notabilis]|uniref:meiosis-specific nuclear structural protein 1 isoform X3 n=1 Tax=Morus notabilis TaxID=981085 RepID=UPI000CED713A|nr:meiosis-specific nuclear structural protein 1 isoform X3 [Morus notabilis]